MFDGILNLPIEMATRFETVLTISPLFQPALAHLQNFTEVSKVINSKVIILVKLKVQPCKLKKHR